MTDYPSNPLEYDNEIPQNPQRWSFPIRHLLFSTRIYRTVRILLAAGFLYSGVAKLLDPTSFAVIIEAFGLIPETWILPVAVILPASEMIAAIGLLLDIRGSLAFITGMLILFLAILAYGIWMGLDIDCGCFGPEDPEARAFHGLRLAFYRDILMMFSIVYLYYWRYRRSTKPARLRHYFSRTYLKNKIRIQGKARNCAKAEHTRSM
ncbi:MauE/DoxX family redox-associated membrane protein [Thermodesulfobacteriota bacterium]